MPNEFIKDQEFPNLFKQVVDALGGDEKSYVEVLKLIQRNLYKIIKRTQIPFVNEESKNIETDLFFAKLTAKLESVLLRWEQANHCEGKHKLKVFLGGGVVRALLAYLYQELLHATKQHASSEKTKDTNRYKSLADFMSESMQSPEYHLRRLSMLRENEKLLKEFVLGVGSDLDIYIELDPPNQQLEPTLIHAAAEFINSVETKMELRGLKGAVKSTFMPIADVKLRNQQLQRSHLQGGSTLDWLSLELTNIPEAVWGLRGPEFIKDFNIMFDFIDGVYRYIEGLEPLQQKQIIRGLRALFEIPFLSIKDMDIIQKQLDGLDFSNLKEETKEQIEKLIRNAYMAGAHNRAHREPGLLSKLAEHQLIPIFAKPTPITAERVIRGQHADLIQAALISCDEFMNNYCDRRDNESVLYHGTDENIKLLYILRNGFIRTGVDGAFGSGVYTSNDHRTAEAYSTATGYRMADTGIVLGLRVIPNSNTRVLKLSELSRDTITTLQQEARANGFCDINDLLCNFYHVDVIIGEMAEIVVQNPAIFARPDPKDILVNNMKTLCDQMLKAHGRWDYLDSIMGAINMLVLLRMLSIPADNINDFLKIIRSNIQSIMAQNILPLRHYYKLLAIPEIIENNMVVEAIINYAKATIDFDYNNDDPGSSKHEFYEFVKNLNELAEKKVISTERIQECQMALVTWHIQHMRTLGDLINTLPFGNQTFNIVLSALDKAAILTNFIALESFQFYQDGASNKQNTASFGLLVKTLDKYVQEGALAKQQQQLILSALHDAAMRYFDKVEIGNLFSHGEYILRIDSYMYDLRAYLIACQTEEVCRSDMFFAIVNILNALIDKLVDLNADATLLGSGSGSDLKKQHDLQELVDKVVEMGSVSQDKAAKLIAKLKSIGCEIKKPNSSIGLRQ
jgi:hypothetical protein